MVKKEVKLIEDVLKMKTELSEKQKIDIKDQMNIIAGLKNEQRSLKETIAKLTEDSDELKTMKKHNNYSSLYDGQ